MLDKLGKFFPGSDKPPADKQQSQPETQPPIVHVEPEPPPALQQPTEFAEPSLLQLCDQKLHRWTKMFSGEDASPAIASDAQDAASLSGMSGDTPAIAPAPQNIAKADNISLLQACDQKLSRWTKMLTGEEKFPRIEAETAVTDPVVEEPAVATSVAAEPAAAAIIPPESTANANSLSLLQKCDRKLSGWTKFFTGEQQSAAMAPEIPVAKAAAEAQTEPVAAAEPAHDQEAAADVSLRKADHKHADKWSNFFSGAKNSVPEAAAEFAEAVTGSADVQPAEKSLETEAPVTMPESKWGLRIIGAQAQAQAQAQEAPTQPPVPKPQILTASAAVAEPPQQEYKIEEQLQMLEQLLERNIMLERQVNKINNSETGLAAIFKEELQRQLSAAAYSYEQQLCANKQAFENMLQSAFDNLVDRQDTLGNSYQRQMDLLRQSLEMQRADFTQLHEKLDGLAEQTRQLADKVLQLSCDIAEQQARSLDIGALAERVSVLEQPPKRRPWFGK